MTTNLMRQAIKQVFKYPFPFHVLQKVLKISNLKFLSIEKDTNVNTFMFKLTANNEWLEIAVAQEEDDPEYGNNIGIMDSSIEKVQNDLHMNGTFFGSETNFDHTSQTDMYLLKKSLAKWEKLSARSR